MSNNEWLPGEAPESGSGNYFRLKDLKKYKDRTAEVRILCPFLHGWEVWVQSEDGKGRPVRARTKEELPPPSEWRVEMRDGKEKRDEPKKFWVTALWNVNKQRIQVFSFTQGTIFGQLEVLASNKRWGPFNAYDLSIQSKGEGLETEYSVTPCPKEPIDPKAAQAWDMLKSEWTGLPAIFSGGDPFVPFSDVPAF